MALEHAHYLDEKSVPVSREYVDGRKVLAQVESETDVPVVGLFGAINIDLFARVRRFPDKDEEELIDGGLEQSLGGRVTNVARGLGRLGLKPYVIGHIGQDANTEFIHAALAEECVRDEFVAEDPDMRTGTVMVMVNQEGQNAYLWDQGANTKVSTADIDNFFTLMRQNGARIDGFYLSLGLPIEICRYAIERCHELNIPVLFDASPIDFQHSFPEDLLDKITFLTCNQYEAGTLTGLDVHDQESAAQAASYLRDRGARNVIITLAEQGSLLLEDGQDTARIYPAKKVEMVDGTGAGDIFRAAFLSRYLKDRDAHAAMVFATEVSAISVTRRGAFASFPTAAEIAQIQSGSGIKSSTPGTQKHLQMVS